MAYLLDTDVLSATRNQKRKPKVVAWLHTLSSSEVFLSVMTLGEIERGIEKQRRLNPQFAADLQQWLDKMLLGYSDRILPITSEIARRWGKLTQVLGNSNADLMIAATALEHGLAVATRNTDHFKPTGVEVFNPFEL